MSTVLHTFIVPKKDVFKFSDAVREHVLSQWRPVFHNEASKVKQTDFIQNHKREFEVSLQFFEPQAARSLKNCRDCYLVRVLSANYMVENWLWNKKYPSCNYDDRTDIPRRERGNKGVADQVDELIRKRHYFIVPAVSVDDYLNIIFETEITPFKETRGNHAPKK